MSVPKWNGTELVVDRVNVMHLTNALKGAASNYPRGK
jgi:hypothetical protein